MAVRGKGAKFWLRDDSAYSRMVKVVSLTPPSGVRDTIDRTNHDTATDHREFMASLIDGGEVAVMLQYVPGSADDLFIREQFESGANRAFAVDLNSATATQRRILGFGIITSYAPADIVIDDKQTATLTMKVTGPLSVEDAIGSPVLPVAPSLLGPLFVAPGTTGQATAIGGAYLGSDLSSPDLPAGWTINSAARTVTPSSAGTFSFTLIETLAGDSGSPRSTAISGLVIALTPVTLATLAFAGGEVGTPLPITGASAGSTITATGLPGGWTLNSAARTITPSSFGVFSFTLIEALAGATNSPRNTPVVNSVVSAVLDPLTFAGGAVGAAIAIGGSTPGSAINSPDLPAGWVLDSNARTITPSSAGTFAFTLTETLAGAIGSPRNTALVNITTISVLSPLTFAGGAIGSTVSIGGASPGSAITSSNLPAGWTLNSAARTITPSSSGTFAFNLTETLAGASNSPRTTNLAGIVINPALAALSVNGAEVGANLPILFTTPGSTISSSNLPSGWTLNSAARTITPSSVGTFSFTIVETLTGATGSPRSNPISGLVITSAPLPIGISGTPGGGIVGTAYTYVPNITNGSGVRTYALTGTLPAGLSFDTNTGEITGTPTTTGTSSGLNITVTDVTGSASVGVFSILVVAANILLSQINADSWSGEAAAPGSLPAYSATLSEFTGGPLAAARIRTGYSNTGAVLPGINEPIYATKRVRQMFPNQASATAATVALSDYLLAADNFPGATSFATKVMPKPIVNWTMIADKIVGNSIKVGVTGNHWSARNKKPFACVIYTATDGVTTVSVTVDTMIVGTLGFRDRCAVLSYEALLDITTLNAGVITVNATVYPHIGVAASIQRSADNTGDREFSPRLFYKNVARFDNPNVVVVATGGNDTTGYVGSDLAQATANPVATYQGAWTRARTVLGTGAGALDGLRIKLTDGVWSFGASVTQSVVAAAVVIERAAGATEAATIFEFGAVSRTSGAAKQIFRAITIRRMGAFYIATGGGLCALEDVTFNPNGNTGALSTATVHYQFNGVDFTTATGNLLGASTAQNISLMRGIKYTGVGTGQWNGFLVIGCEMINPGTSSWGGRSQTNSIIQFNKFLNTGSQFGITIAGEPTITNVSVSQNLIEVIHSVTSQKAIGASNDGDIANLTHILFDNNTVAASNWQAGRCNVFYDELVGTYRQHDFCRFGNTVCGTFYHKGDWFVGANGNGTPNPTDAPFHTGNRAQTYAVGFRNVLTMMINGGTNSIGGNQGLAYAGPGNIVAPAGNNPAISLAPGVNFVNWQATTTNVGSGLAVAGTGGGDYHPPSGSALLNRVLDFDEVFPFDLDGVAKTRGSIGCYA